MSVTIAQVLQLPSMRRAKVIGGQGGLSQTVTSVSVLEYAQPTPLLEELFHTIEFRGSDIPSGMVHALGGCQGDLVVYEIQQSSDITYRFWDWGRVDQQGRPRELHTQQALAVAKAELSLSPVSGATVLCQGGSVTYYIADRHFELSRLNVAGDMPLAAGRMLLITALGCGRLRWPQGQLELGPGQTALVPAGLEGAVLSGQLSALCSSTPNQQPLRALLGYRAGQVAGLTS